MQFTAEGTGSPGILWSLQFQGTCAGVMVLNATSAGLSGESLSIDWSRARREIVAYDLLYAAEQTPFLRDAAGQGIWGVDGRHMLVAQAALALEFWTGEPVSRQIMMGALPG